MGEFISMGTSIQTDPKRVSVILEVVMNFFEGVPPLELTRQVESELGKISAGEFAYAAQILANRDTGVDPIEAKVRRELLMHEVFQDALEDGVDPGLGSGHPVTTMRLENEAITRLIAEIRALMSSESGNEGFDVSGWSPLLKQLGQVDVHYTRKENQLFPVLERKGFDRPSTIMWAVHDTVRENIKAAQAAFDANRQEELSQTMAEAIVAVEDMILKEDQVLIPTSLELLNDREWAEIRAGDDEIGYCLIDSPPPWDAPDRDSEAAPAVRDVVADLPLAKPFVHRAHVPDRLAVGSMMLSGGSLTPAQLNGLFRNLPADITYVDEHDRVRFYNRGEDRVFPRSPGIIGREVRYCHPPKSVHIVLEIVEEFRAGNRDTAEFWIQMGEMFVYIRYYVIRDDQGAYRGVLEVSQEVSAMRRPLTNDALAGNRERSSR